MRDNENESSHSAEFCGFQAKNCIKLHKNRNFCGIFPKIFIWQSKTQYPTPKRVGKSILRRKNTKNRAIASDFRINRSKMTEYEEKIAEKSSLSTEKKLFQSEKRKRSNEKSHFQNRRFQSAERISNYSQNTAFTNRKWQKPQLSVDFRFSSYFRSNIGPARLIVISTR